MKTASFEHKNSLKKGFTLVEILISIAVMGIIFGIGMAKYKDFNNSQTTVSAIKDLKNNLRNIQSYASSGVKPTGCASLDGYQVTYNNTTSYNYQAYCGGTPIGSAITYNLPANIVFYQTFTAFQFKPLSKGTSAASNMVIKNPANNTCITLNILTSGSISQNTATSCTSAYHFPAHGSFCSVVGAISCSSSSVNYQVTCYPSHVWTMSWTCQPSERCNPTFAQCKNCTKSCGSQKCCFNPDGSMFCQSGSCPNYPS